MIAKLSVWKCPFIPKAMQLEKVEYINFKNRLSKFNLDTQELN